MLYPVHTTTSLSANQLFHFARAVGLEVSLASYGLLEDLFLNARGTGNLSVWGHPARSAVSSAVRSVLGDSVASQSRYSLPTVSGFALTVASVDAVQSGEVEQFIDVQPIDAVRFEGAVIISSNKDDMPLGALSWSLRSKSKKKVRNVKIVESGASKSDSC